MTGHPQPVPPVFSPDLPAKAIRYLAEHPRRNMWVGVSTAYTILAERIAPGLVDWYLGRTGVKSQQTDEDLPRWGPNLYEPRDEEVDRGAHGPFGDLAHDRDPWLWMSMRRRGVMVGAGLAMGATTVAARARARRR